MQELDISHQAGVLAEQQFRELLEWYRSLGPAMRVIRADGSMTPILPVECPAGTPFFRWVQEEVRKQEGVGFVTGHVGTTEEGQEMLAVTVAFQNRARVWMTPFVRVVGEILFQETTEYEGRIDHDQVVASECGARPRVAQVRQVKPSKQWHWIDWVPRPMYAAAALGIAIFLLVANVKPSSSSLYTWLGWNPGNEAAVELASLARVALGHGNQCRIRVLHGAGVNAAVSGGCTLSVTDNFIEAGGKDMRRMRAIIAHELAHSLAGYPEKALLAAQVSFLDQRVSLLLHGFAGDFGYRRGSGLPVIDLENPTIEEEREADLKAVELLYRAGDSDAFDTMEHAIILAVDETRDLHPIQVELVDRLASLKDQRAHRTLVMDHTKTR